MPSDCPKTTASGGISPTDCTRELTEFVVVIAVDIAGCGSLSCEEMCIPGTKPEPVVAQKRNPRLKALLTVKYISYRENLASGNSNRNKSC